jgi:glutamyl-tRNA reductase
VKLLLLGMNHRSAPVEVRERFAVAHNEPMLRKLIDRPGIEEAVLLSTCNRVEVVVATHNADAARHVLLDFFAHDLAEADLPAGVSLSELTYLRQGRDAVEHVFRVASAIDSMVVGEPQILGQVKDAYRDAVEVRACGAILSRLYQRAFATAKRVRNETRIAERPISVARVAVDLAEQIFERLDDKSALLIGAGDMIEAALVALDDHGLGQRRIANRTRARAEPLARRFGGSAHGLDELDELLAKSDVVLTCVAADGPVLVRSQIESALGSRGSRPLFLIDIGVPRNVDPGVHEIDDAYLYDLDDLQEVAAENAEERRRESERAERIISEEREHFDGWLATLQAVPTIRDLRRRADAIRRAELERHVRRLGLDADQSKALEQLTRRIVNKIMHAPISRLRDEPDREVGLARLDEVRALFGLDEEDDPLVGVVGGSDDDAGGDA